MSTQQYQLLGWHTSKDGAKWIIENTQTIGEAICKGVCSYFGVPYKSDSTAPSGKLYRVQVGAFSQKANAEKQLEKAKNAGFSDAYIVEV